MCSAEHNKIFAMKTFYKACAFIVYCIIIYLYTRLTNLIYKQYNVETHWDLVCIKREVAPCKTCGCDLIIQENVETPPKLTEHSINKWIVYQVSDSTIWWLGKDYSIFLTWLNLQSQLRPLQHFMLGNHRIRSCLPPST